jgi:hypothetical protein
VSDEDCEICQFAHEFHHWPMLDNEGAIANPGDVMLPGHEGRKNIITHCGGSRRAGTTGCHTSWKSIAQAHCVVEGCHQQFATNGSADYHWVNKGARGAPKVHVHPSESSHLVLVDEQFGPVWHRVLESEDVE